MIVIQPHTDCVNVVCFAPDGSRLASVSQDGWVKVWDPAQLHTGTPVWEVLGDLSAETESELAFREYAEDDVFDVGGLSHAQFTSDGKTLITSGWERHVRAWNTKTGKELWQVTNPIAWSGVGTLVISRDGKYLAFAGGQIGFPERVYVVDLKTKAIIKTLRGHADACGATAAGPEGLATGGADKHVKFWSWDTGRCYHDLALRGIVRGLVFSPDGSRFAAAGGSVVMVWDMTRPKGKGRRRPNAVRHFRGHTDQIQCLDFSPDGNTLASSSHDGTIRTWDVAAGAEIRAYAPKAGQLHHVAFAPDGLTLAFSSEKGHVGILDLDG